VAFGGSSAGDEVDCCALVKEAIRRFCDNLEYALLSLVRRWCWDLRVAVGVQAIDLDWRTDEVHPAACRLLVESSAKQEDGGGVTIADDNAVAANMEV